MASPKWLNFNFQTVRGKNRNGFGRSFKPIIGWVVSVTLFHHTLICSSLIHLYLVTILFIYNSNVVKRSHSALIVVLWETSRLVTYNGVPFPILHCSLSTYTKLRRTKIVRLLIEGDCSCYNTIHKSCFSRDFKIKINVFFSLILLDQITISNSKCLIF